MVILEMLYCDKMQGYYFSQPLPAAECEALAAGLESLAATLRSAHADGIVLDGGVGRMVQLARANLRNLPRP